MSHLGGHGGTTWVDVGTLRYLKEKFDIATMLDVGCGPMGMSNVARKMSVAWHGIDGDPAIAVVAQGDPTFFLHDFNTGPFIPASQYDLGWSVEFLEHVEEQYQSNYMAAFQKCKYVVCTAAPPGWGGFHHVNEQEQDYWKTKFKEYGFTFDAHVTSKIRHITTMKQKRGMSFMQRTGMFYVNNNIVV